MPDKLYQQERMHLALHWYEWFLDHTDSFEGRLGMQLAYLWPAILKGTKIDCSERDPVVQILHLYEVPESDPIWQHINYAKAVNEDGTPICNHEADPGSADVNYDVLLATWVVDFSCKHCGENGSHQLREDSVVWENIPIP